MRNTRRPVHSYTTGMGLRHCFLFHRAVETRVACLFVGFRSSRFMVVLVSYTRTKTLEYCA